MEDSKPALFNSLPKELLYDIFSRVPLKTLSQFLCVCRKWRFFFTQDLEFIGFYHKKHRINPLLVFTQQISETPLPQLSSNYIDGTQFTQFSNDFPRPLTSILTTNGVLCLISSSSLCLYDPTTKRVSALPNSDNFESTFSWAFGNVSNPSRNVSKLLHFYISEKFDNFHYCQRKEVMCEILTEPGSNLGSDSNGRWRLLGKCPYDFLGRKPYTIVDNKIYWLIAEKKLNPDIKIMSFHLGIESFGVLSFHKSNSNRSVECLDLVEIKDNLCLTDRLPWDSIMDIWMMERDNYWVKKYRIDLKGIVNHHGLIILGHFPKMEEKEEDEGEILMKFGGQSFGFYDLGKGYFRDLAGEMNIQGRDLKLLVNRKCL